MRTDRSFPVFSYPASRYQIHARRKLQDDLRASRGICLAVVLGLAVWSVLAVVVWMLWR
jgi:hypothetical protein